MNSVHLMAVALTLFLYTILGVAFFGWGRVVIHIVGLIRTDRETLPVSFSVWTGWVFSLFVFHLVHFVYPLNAYSTMPVFIIGIALSARFFSRRPRWCPNNFSIRKLMMSTGIMLILLVVILWVVSRAMLSPASYDSGLYHFNIIRWINFEPIVPGLGNLHGRLAFNHSFFTYVAALNFYPFFGHGRSIANSFLFILTILTFFEILTPFFKRPSLMTQSDPLQWGPALFSFPILIFWAFTSKGLASPSTDLTSGLLILVIFMMFAQVMGFFARAGRLSLCKVFVVSVLAATTITTKLSNVVFVVVVMTFISIWVKRTSKTWLRDFVIIISPAIMIVFVWCVRGFILSGAPLYPSAILYFPTEWAVPIDKVADEANWVYSWARQSNTHWSNVLGSWDWLAGWMRHIAVRTVDIVYPLVVFLVVGILCIVMAVFSRIKEIRRNSWQFVIVLPLISGLAFWFFTAPDPRFASALLFLMPVSAVLLFLSFMFKRTQNRALIGMTICVLFIAANINLFKYAVQNRSTVLQISTVGWGGIRRASLVERVTKFGLRVFTPESGLQCWDSPLPCTPYFNPDLRTRIPDDISSGFTVRKATLNHE